MRLAIYGSTGSIGRNTLKLLAHAEKNHAHQECRLIALSAHNNLALLARQALQWQPEYLLVSQPYDASRQAHFAGFKGEILWGKQELANFASSHACDNILLAITGSAALPTAYAAASTGKRLLLANKEALVAAGDLIVAASRSSGATLVPVDSEHNGLWQCLGMPDLPGEIPLSVAKLTLTASGGPFWNWPRERIYHASLADACQHPNWRMGEKISVDSATMVNKALELIEAHKLFALAADNLEVLVHPQSLVHAMVHFRSGSSLAQLSLPDMRVALASALFGQQASPSGVAPLGLPDCSELSFYPPDNQRFVSLPLARQAMLDGKDRCLCLDISNEVANAAFRQGKIPFGAIVETIEDVINASDAVDVHSIEEAQQRQQQLASLTRQLIASRHNTMSHKQRI